ncbi:MAG TPA: hypothetical protein VGB15_19030 [Longimicrobium sp.]|jgi:hypothetical protein
MLDEQALSAAGRLIQHALRPNARPAGDGDYGQLMDRFIDDTEFRGAVRAVAGGLGLWMLDYGEHGIVLAPQAGSVFEMRTSEWRVTPGTGVEERLLDGLIQVGIAATLFPRADDLEDDSAKPPITVEEVEETLRQLCARLEAESAGRADPAVSPDGTALDEAWRLYHDRLAAAEGRRATRTTRGMISSALEYLRAQGCFVRLTEGTAVRYRSTWRYEAMVRELAATALYERVQEALAHTQEAR